MSGWLGDNFGWESIFYVFGIAAIIWSLIWFMVVSSSPQNDKWISRREKLFIADSLRDQRDGSKALSVPWKSIFTSKPVFAITIAVGINKKASHF